METPKLLPSLRPLVLFVLLIATTGVAAGQSSALPQWGLVSPADRALRYYPADPSAPALVLSDYQAVVCNLYETGVLVRTQHHRRIKYFESFAYAKNPARIEWYRSDERISRLRGLLHLPNGKIEKLRKKDFRAEPMGGGWYQYVLNIPKVPAGSILEYTYQISSGNFNQLPVWYFQQQYPVRRSEYRATVPDQFDYVALALPDSSWLTSGKLQQSRARPGETPTLPNELRLVAESLPPIPQEPYTNNTFDYIPQAKIRLRSITWPGLPPSLEHPTWPELADYLRADRTFGRHYLGTERIDTVMRAIAPLLAAAPDTLARARIAYRAIAERMRWNGSYGVQTERSPTAIWTDGTGHSGELNLLLLAVFRNLGIPAYPVLAGTRDSGAPIEQLAQFEQFNHMLVVARFADQTFFLDVNGPYRPIGLPRPAALNNRGWLVTDSGQAWIDLRLAPSEQTIQAKLALDSTGLARGTLEAKMTGYYAAFARERLANATTAEREPLVDALQDYYPTAEWDNRTYYRQDSIAEPFRIDLAGQLPLAYAEQDRLYVTSVLLPALNRELATAEPRQFPFDMPFPWTEHYLLFLDMPDGYTVEAFPEPVQLRSPDEMVSFDYSFRQVGRQLIVQYRFSIARTFYPPEEYTAIRDIFLTAIDRQDGAIVLRRGSGGDE